MTAFPVGTLLVGGYAAADQPGIHILSFDATAGVLTPVTSYAGVVNPSFLLLHPNGQWLYATGETAASDGAPGSVWALRVTAGANGQPPQITAGNQQSSGGDAPCHLALDASGRWLVVSNYTSGSVNVLPLGDDGLLGTPTDHHQHVGHGADPDRQGGPHAHSATWTPDNRRVIIADLGLDQLIAYQFDATTGTLHTPVIGESHAGAGPRHCVFHPNGTWLYVANELDSTVSWYTYDAANGRLTEQQHIPTVPPTVANNAVADIHLTPDGKQLYVSNRGDNSLALFAVANNGELTLVTTSPCGGNWPRNFALAPTGSFVAVANQYSGDVTILPITAGGGLGTTVAQFVVEQPAYVQFVSQHE